MMNIKIYTLSSTRNPDNIRYVGKTKQTLKKRLSQHLLDAKNYRKLGNFKNYNYNWICNELNNDYEILIQEIDSLEFEESEDWQWLEQYWISQMRIWGFKLTNLTEGGDGNQNQHFSKESIEKRASKIRGIPRDTYTKIKISEGLKGIKRSDETKLKVSKAITELIGRKINQFDSNGILVKEWESIAQAAKELNLDKGNIGHCCNHKPNHNSSGGFYWRYIEDSTPINIYTPNSIVQLDLKGNLISIYKTAILAAKATGVSSCSISICCNGKIENVKGFIFKKYKDFMNT